MNKIQLFWLKGGCLTAAVGIIVLGFTQATSFHVNESLSLPYRYFFCFQTAGLHKGQLVVFKGHQTDYFKNKVYAKYVTGLPGDKIHYVDGILHVGSKAVGLQKKRTKDGRLLTPIQEKTVPAGYVFVVGKAKDSFDSRYEEFGLVKRECVVNKCIGLGQQSAYRP